MSLLPVGSGSRVSGVGLRERCRAAGPSPEYRYLVRAQSLMRHASRPSSSMNPRPSSSIDIEARQSSPMAGACFEAGLRAAAWPLGLGRFVLR